MEVISFFSSKREIIASYGNKFYFNFILENKKLENKMKGSKVKVYRVLTLANVETEVLLHFVTGKYLLWKI